MKYLIPLSILLFLSCSAKNSGETIDTTDVRADFNLSDDRGNEVSMDSLKNKYLFVNFWATWCKPCIAELPSIEALQDSLKDQNISFFLITNETPEQVNGFLTKRNIDLPGYYMTDAVEAFELIGFPTTLIIDPAGDVVLQVEGADDWNTPANVAMVKGLINASE